MKYIFKIIPLMLLLAFTSPNEEYEFYSIIKKPKTITSETRILIMMHGLGSNEKDLFSFSNQLSEDIMIVSLRAPYSYGKGFAWYDVDFSSGQPKSNKEQVSASSNKLISFIKNLKSTYSIKNKNIYLMGFSQGAIMSFHVALLNPELVGGIACFSGRLMEFTEKNISDDSKKKLKNLNVFLSHGKKDNMLSFSYSKKYREKLDTLGIKYTFFEFEGGHSIPTNSFTAFNNWFKSKL